MFQRQRNKDIMRILEEYTVTESYEKGIEYFKILGCGQVAQKISLS
jgi:hypothetical protein